MKEYIERERLKEAFNADLQTLQSLDEHTMNLILIEIDEAPAADVAEVRHGRWEKHPQSNEDDPVYTCSLCKLNVSGFEKRWIKYCPNCGALMDGKEDEHEAG